MWLKINSRGYAGFGPCFFPLTMVPLWYRFSEPQPIVETIIGIHCPLLVVKGYLWT